MAKNKKKNKNTKPKNQQINKASEVETKVEVAEDVEVETPDVPAEEVANENVEEKNVNKKDSKEKDKKKDKKAKQPKKSLGSKIKEVNSELKKVSWPKFSKVVKTTGVVILVVLICTLILFGLDMALKYGIYDQIIG